MLILKHAVVWLAELCCFSFLLGCVLYVTWGTLQIGKKHSAAGSVVGYAVLIVFVFMLNSGFLLTTGIAGVFFRSRRYWVYPLIAALLFVIHLQFHFTGWTEAQKAPIQLIGALLLFLCTLLGGWLLAKWQLDSKPAIQKI